MPPKKHIIIIGVLCVIALGLGYWVGMPPPSPPPPPPPEFLKQGLVAYYPFNGNAKDESGNGNDGEVRGATLSNDRHGIAGGAFSFDESHIKIEHEQLPQGAEPRTLSLWAKVRILPSNMAFLARWGRASPTQAYGIYIQHGEWVGSTYSPELRSKVSINTIWNHVSLTYDEDVLSIFVNGILHAKNGRVSNTTGINLFLGCEVDSVENNSFKGLIDNIRIYNRALSEAEVKALYEFEKTN